MVGQFEYRYRAKALAQPQPCINAVRRVRFPGFNFEGEDAHRGTEAEVPRMWLVQKL
jgi:hypothetical protein